MRTAWLVALFLFTVDVRAQEDGLGLNTHAPDTGLLDMCQDLGINWIRVDGNWDGMNPSAGVYDWSWMDPVVNGARTRGLKVYMTLGYTPAWVPTVSRTRTDTWTGNDEPLTGTEWVAFVTAAVNHFQPLGVTYYGIWNEANLDGFWENAAGADPWANKIVLPGAQAVKAACPSCKVLGPELAHVGDYHVFLDRVLTLAEPSWDIITHHTYNGWPETGTQIWDGDNFLQAIESRRFSFTRPALREVLDMHGVTKQVWITETGYRATPGDAALEDKQAIYVRRVMEEQLARAWWSNTFFYEIMDCGLDDSNCDIDGFGITRGTHPLTSGPRSFPADYRLKPAYTQIKGFITAHPELVMSTPPPQCADGLDNDHDGLTDSMDPGCTDGADNNEADDPPRRRLSAANTGNVTVDGSLAEWNAAEFTALPDADWRGVVALTGAADLQVRIAARHQPGTLWLAVDVTDDEQVNTNADDTLWRADGVQLAFDCARNGGMGYDATDDHEINVALVNGQARTFRFAGPAAATSNFQAAVVRSGNSTVYEVRLDSAQLTPATLQTGDILGFSFLVNDNDGLTTMDGTGREGWKQFTDGIGVNKTPATFGELLLSPDSVSIPDAGGLPDAAITPDAAVAGDSGSGMPDASTATPDAAIHAADASVATPDAGSNGADGGNTKTTDGCNCRESASNLAGGWMLAALLAGKLSRRRKAGSAKPRPPENPEN